MTRRGADLALLMLAGFRSLADAATMELARRGFEDVRPSHEFALRAIAAGAGNASELGRVLAVSKQAAAKTIALLEQRGYIARAATAEARRQRLIPTARGHALLDAGDAVFDALHAGLASRMGAPNLEVLESLLAEVVGNPSAATVVPGHGAVDLPGMD